MAEVHVSHGAVLLSGSRHCEGVRDADHSMWPHASPQEEDAGWKWPGPVEQGSCIGRGQDGRRQLGWTRAAAGTQLADPGGRQGGMVIIDEE